MATDTVYDVSITGNRWRGMRMAELTSELTQMWENVIDTVRTDGALSTDLVRIHISHRDLKKGDIKVPLQKLGELTPQVIMDRIATVLQSHDQIKADNILEISVGLIKFPRGEGRQNITNIQGLNSCGKRSLTYVQNNDNKCLARAIAISEAWQHYEDQNPEGKNNRKGRSHWRNFVQDVKGEQGVRAAAIIELAGLKDEEWSSIGAIPRYEEALKANIVVISSVHNNQVIHPKALKPEYANTYYIYYVKCDDDDVGHFHSVKSPTGVLAMNYFCKQCLRGYDHKYKHSCAGVCSQCKSTECLPTPNKCSPRSCKNCHVTFQSDECFINHLQPSEKTKSVCDKFWKCTSCSRCYEKHQTRPEDHKCDHYFCNICEKQAHVEKHLCYQRSLKETHPCDKFIFFDFESSQEDSGLHIPNLVVARRYNLKKDKDHFDEKVFRDDDVRHVFGSWLFDKANRGYTVVAHNMKASTC